MSRLEGIFYSVRDRMTYIVDTSSGEDTAPESGEFGQEGCGDGPVWTLDAAPTG